VIWRSNSPSGWPPPLPAEAIVDPITGMQDVARTVERQFSPPNA